MRRLANIVDRIEGRKWPGWPTVTEEPAFPHGRSDALTAVALLLRSFHVAPFPFLSSWTPPFRVFRLLRITRHSWARIVALLVVERDEFEGEAESRSSGLRMHTSVENFFVVKEKDGMALVP